MTRAVVTACITAVACAAVPGMAAAKAQKPPQTATFKATVKGSQVTHWELHREGGNCVAPAEGFGDQSIKFSGKPFKLTFTRPPKGDPDLFSTRGRPVVSEDPVQYRADFEAERNVDVKYGQVSGCDGGDNGGGVDPDKGPPRDCGVRTGTAWLNFSYFDDDVQGDVPVSKQKNKLLLLSGLHEWAGSHNDLDDAYVNCDLEVGDHILRVGALYPERGALSEKQVFNPKRKNLRVSAGRVVKINESDRTGQTITTWNLKLKRIK